MATVFLPVRVAVYTFAGNGIFIPNLQIPLGVWIGHLWLRIHQAIILSQTDNGSFAYGSACDSMLKELDPVHHAALRICSGAFRTSSVLSPYVTCNLLTLDLRRK
ncbi:putative RNA-directed DNA polymerase from transposon X-element [Trichonephila clavipes]|nr:putative RNA-directed DNA polymerase from transposon X-element [Trichonephila clavipes]